MGINPNTHKPISTVVTVTTHNVTTRTASYNKLNRDQQHKMPSYCLLSLTVPPYPSDFNHQYSLMPHPYIPQSPTASSSSCTVNQHPVESFPNGATQPSSFGWIDNLLQDTTLCINDDSDCTTQGGFSYMPPVSASPELDGTASNPFEACLSSSSFVDAMLYRDLEIISEFPRLLYESFEY